MKSKTAKTQLHKCLGDPFCLILQELQNDSHLTSAKLNVKLACAGIDLSDTKTLKQLRSKTGKSFKKIIDALRLDDSDLSSRKKVRALNMLNDVFCTPLPDGKPLCSDDPEKIQDIIFVVADSIRDITDTSDSFKCRYVSLAVNRLLASFVHIQEQLMSAKDVERSKA